jgi:Flp pilus assembly protein TadD
MGIVRLRSEDFSGARDYFRKSLSLDETSPRSWNGLGVALMNLGDAHGALDAWSKAVDLDPAMYDALLNLGLAAAKVGDREQARTALRRFTSTAPPTLYGADLAKARGVLKALETGAP